MNNKPVNKPHHYLNFWIGVVCGIGACFTLETPSYVWLLIGVAGFNMLSAQLHANKDNIKDLYKEKGDESK